jgi:hypothetical protein
MDTLDERSYHFLIKAVANLNYHDANLIETLKMYNYELFLNILKYNRENSGEYYQKII